MVTLCLILWASENLKLNSPENASILQVLLDFAIEFSAIYFPRKVTWSWIGDGTARADSSVAQLIEHSKLNRRVRVRCLAGVSSTSSVEHTNFKNGPLVLYLTSSLNVHEHSTLH